MVFALPVALPMSIYENIVYGPRLCGISDRGGWTNSSRRACTAAFLWDEVKDRLKTVRPAALRRPAAAPLPRARRSPWSRM